MTTARLVVRYPSLLNRTFAFGRTTANDVVVRDPRVSRRHAKITPRHDSYLLIDLKSQNGTYVNDAPINEHVLEHGDEVRIADHRFIFLAAGEEVMVDSRATEITVLSDEERGQTITLETRLEDEALPLSVVEDTPAHSTMMRRLQDHLEALHQMPQIMAADVEQPVLLERICDLLIESFVAERACIVLQDPITGDLNPTATAYSDSEERCLLPLSRTIIEQVRTERSALLCTDAKSDPRLGRAPSVSSHEIRSVMCVPLIRGDELLGILYVDNRSMPGEFTEGDLWLLRAMGNQAAVVIEKLPPHVLAPPAVGVPKGTGRRE